jgi:hypothetical protein
MSAIHHFSRFPMARTVHMQIVKVFEPARETSSFLTLRDSILARAGQSIRTRAPNELEDLIPSASKAGDLSESLTSPKDSSRVHCEASIMALMVGGDPALITSSSVST